MKKIIVLVLLVFFTAASTGFCGGDKVRADKASGPAGLDGQGTVKTNRGG